VNKRRSWNNVEVMLLLFRSVGWASIAACEPEGCLSVSLTRQIEIEHKENKRGTTVHSPSRIRSVASPNTPTSTKDMNFIEQQQYQARKMSGAGSEYESKQSFCNSNNRSNFRLEDTNKKPTKPQARAANNFSTDYTIIQLVCLPVIVIE